MENDETTAEGIEQHDNENDEATEFIEETEDESLEVENDEPIDDGTDWKAEALKYKAILERNKSKKAEVRVESAKKTGDINTRDLYALIDAKIPQDDIGDVVEYAKFKNISVSEAIKSNVVKTILVDRAESRNSANASNTGTARRGSGKLSDDALVVKANKGEGLDESEIERMYLLRKRS